MRWRKKKEEGPPEKVYLKVVGWGPFPMPGEKRRQQEAARKARETMRIVSEIEQRG